MISILATFALCLLPAQEPIQHELQLHSLEGLMNPAVQDAAKNLPSGLPSTPNGVEVSYPFRSAEDLLENVRTFMTPSFDPKRQSLKIERSGVGRVLLAYLQPSQNEWLTKFLEFQRHSDAWQVLLKIQVFLPPAGFKVEGDSSDFLFDGPQETEAIGGQYRNAGADLLSSPSMMILPGQKGTITVQKQSAYVSAWDMVKVQPGGDVVADPTIEIIDEGMVFVARVMQVSEKLYGLSIDLQMSRIEEPFATKKISIDGKKFEIGVPEIVTANIATMIKLPAGGGILLRSPNYEEQRDLVLLVSFQRIEAKK